MKNSLFLGLAVISLLFLQCSQDGGSVTPVTPAPQVDYEKVTIKLMDELAPQLLGRWTLRQVDIKVQSYNVNQKKLQLAKDTVLLNLATLTIRSATQLRMSPQDPRHPEFEGTIEFRGKTYPIGFYLLANAERVVSNKGPQAHLLFEYRFPNGTRIPESEETLLNDLGVVGDNFSLEIVPGQSAMTWRGLNRGVDKIDLQKQ